MKLASTDKRPRPASIVGATLIVEIGCGAVAVVAGRLIGLSPLAELSWNSVEFAWGVAATLPLLASLWWAVNYPIGPLRGLARLEMDWLVPMFGHCNWIHLALISVAAGLGEEVLFRGVVQEGIARWTASPAAGLVLASLLFGLAHPISWLYVVLAALIGLYLGWLWIATENLLVPITTHAVYDFVALVYLAFRAGEHPSADQK